MIVYPCHLTSLHLSLVFAPVMLRRSLKPRAAESMWLAPLPFFFKPLVIARNIEETALDQSRPDVWCMARWGCYCCRSAVWWKDKWILRANGGRRPSLQPPEWSQLQLGGEESLRPGGGADFHVLNVAVLISASESGNDLDVTSQGCVSETRGQSTWIHHCHSAHNLRALPALRSGCRCSTWQLGPGWQNSCCSLKLANKKWTFFIFGW